MIPHDPAWVVTVRAMWTSGKEQQAALAELDRRGLWLTEEQKITAGLACPWPRKE